jgi:uncharacterized membrane protein YgcG
MADFWTNASLEQRRGWLQRMENYQAQRQNRPPAQVQLREMSSNQRGCYRRQDNTIYLNRDMVQYMDHPQQSLQTLFHEGRHAYQCHAVQHPDKHPEVSQAQRDTWTQNLRKYRPYTQSRVDRITQRTLRDHPELTAEQRQQQRAKVDKAVYRSYRDRNPIEIDAREDAEHMMKIWKKQESKWEPHPIPIRSENGQNGKAPTVQGNHRAIQDGMPQYLKAPTVQGNHTVGHSQSAGKSGHSASGHSSSSGGHGASGGHGGTSGGHGASGGHGGSSGGHGH